MPSQPPTANMQGQDRARAPDQADAGQPPQHMRLQDLPWKLSDLSWLSASAGQSCCTGIQSARPSQAVQDLPAAQQENSAAGPSKRGSCHSAAGTSGVGIPSSIVPQANTHCLSHLHTRQLGAGTFTFNQGLQALRSGAAKLLASTQSCPAASAVQRRKPMRAVLPQPDQALGNLSSSGTHAAGHSPAFMGCSNSPAAPPTDTGAHGEQGQAAEHTSQQDSQLSSASVNILWTPEQAPVSPQRPGKENATPRNSAGSGQSTWLTATAVLPSSARASHASGGSQRSQQEPDQAAWAEQQQLQGAGAQQPFGLASPLRKLARLQQHMSAPVTDPNHFLPIPPLSAALPHQQVTSVPTSCETLSVNAQPVVSLVLRRTSCS